METREFTPEELAQPITLERINEYHVNIGEDFADQQTIGVPMMFAGFLLAKYPDKGKTIIRIVNEGYLDMQCLQEVFGEEMDDASNNAFYTEYAEYINHTSFSKAEVNKVLITKKEHYKY